MKKIKLGSLIYKNFMTAALIPILFIEIALLILYFSINTYTSNKISDTFIVQSKLSIDSVVNNEVSIINNQLKEIERYASQLQGEHQAFLERIDSFQFKVDVSDFGFHKNGVYFKQRDNGGSAVYYSSDTEIGKEQKRKIFYTEMLDPGLKAIVNNNDLAAQVYINTYDNMNRIYPFISDIPNQYGPVLNMEDFNFYYEADLKHNPAKKPVWTSVYLDPAGMGWLMSCIVPVYKDNFLEWVAGIDITVEKLIAHILNKKFPNNSKAFIVDDTGMILAMGEEIERLLDLQELKEHAYEKKIDKTIYKPEVYNLYLNPDPSVRENLSRIFKGKVENTEADIKGRRYYVTHKIIPQTRWHLFVMTDMNELVEPIMMLKSMSFRIGAGAIILMVFFYLAFFMFFKKKSASLADMISKPIVSLSEDTKYIGTEFFAYDYIASDIEEIEQLNKNFEEMTSQLESRTKELIRAEVEKLEKEQEAEALLMMSRTDALTGVYNRLKLDELLDYELEQAARYQKSLSIVITDIDFFKKVNDVHGHQAGDRVLKVFADILSKNVRGSDTVARWGGEEFIILFTNTAGGEAFAISEKLRRFIENYDFGIGNKITSSFGVAEYIKGETKEAFIKRADDALYEAKHVSRNVVIRK